MRHVDEGDTVHVVFLADCVSSRSEAKTDDVSNRIAASKKAQNILGIASSTFLGLPDNRLDSIPLIEVVRPLETLLHHLEPQTIYTHHNGDLNVDHRVAHQAVLTACRQLPHSTVKQILSFEIMSSTEWNSLGGEAFQPNWFVNITGYLDRKMAALEAYTNEIRSEPHSRSKEHILSLARHRGYSVGIPAAEAFMAIRCVN